LIDRPGRSRQRKKSGEAAIRKTPFASEAARQEGHNLFGALSSAPGADDNACFIDGDGTGERPRSIPDHHFGMHHDLVDRGLLEQTVRASRAYLPSRLKLLR